MNRRKSYKLINSKPIFIISLIVIPLTILIVYIIGLDNQNTFTENSIISTSILSTSFFLFITTGLYKGIKLKDSLGKITDKYEPLNTSWLSANILSYGPSSPGDGIIGVIVSILLWIMVAIVFSVALWVFSNIIVLVMLFFAGLLYWIFFRALRLVFKNSIHTKGKPFESVKIGSLYTVLYTSWIYGIFMLIEYVYY